METPLTATARIDFVYTINTLPHHLVHYCEWDGSTSTPTLARNGGGAAIALQDAADSITAAMSQIFSQDDDQNVDFTLQERSGSVWLDRVFGTSHMDTDWTNVRIPASQMTLVLRDTEFKFLRVVYLESAQPLPYHFSSMGSNTGPLHTFSTRLWSTAYAYNSPSESATNAWDWVKSRGDNFLNSSAFVGITGDFNDKVRRARGLT